MSENNAIRAFSSHDISVFLHHTEVGETIRQTTFARETYLGVVRIYGLRNKEYLLENVAGLKVGDRVTLQRKYNSESPDCTAVASAYPDDGSSIRVHTLAGLCLGYIQPPESFVLAELMKAGKHLYAKVHDLHVSDSLEDLDTHKAVTLDVYWVEETAPFKIANTYVLGSPKYDAMVQNGNAILLDQGHPYRPYTVMSEIVENARDLKVGDRLKLVRKAGGDNPDSIEIWTDDRKKFLGCMRARSNEMISRILDAGKCIYGMINFIRIEGRNNNSLLLYFDVYLEDN